MNRENILKVADAIEAHPNQFDLRVWDGGENMLHSCGSVGCVGGWTNTIFEKQWSPNSSSTEAAQHLGLTRAQASELFFPGSDRTVWGRNPYSARAPRAVAVLRAIADGTKTFICDR